MVDELTRAGAARAAADLAHDDESRYGRGDSTGGSVAMDAGFELTEHTADVGIRAYGPSREDVFDPGCAGDRLADLRPGDASEPRDDVPIVLTAENDELLLAAWLNELLFLFETRHLVCAGFQVDEVGGGRLWARARGEKHDAKRHEVQAQVKAATYHGLELKRADGGWEGRVVLDV